VNLLAWIFIVIDALTILLLIIFVLRGNQDAAGRSMLLLPVVCMIGATAGAYKLLVHDYPGWAVVVAGIPAVVALYIAYLSLPRNNHQ
jgi:hypothetical protein